MSSFAQTWNESTPAGSDYANQLDTFIQNFKVGLRERADLEHYTYGGAFSKEDRRAPDRHRPGFVGAVYSGTTAQITSLIATLATPASFDGQMAYGPGDGAIFYNTETGRLLRFNSSSPTLGGCTDIGGPNLNVSGSNYSTLVNKEAAFIPDQTTLDQLFGKTSGSNTQDGMVFSATRGTFVTFSAYLTGGGTLYDSFGFALSASSAVNPANTMGSVVLSTRATGPTGWGGGASILVPAGWYFRIRVFASLSQSIVWQASFELNRITPPIINTYFTVFNLQRILI